MQRDSNLHKPTKSRLMLPETPPLDNQDLKKNLRWNLKGLLEWTIGVFVILAHACSMFGRRCMFNVSTNHYCRNKIILSSIYPSVLSEG